VPGDSAITRGDQIRKRNVYCRRRTRLSSFSEIIRLEEGQEEEGSFVWRTGGVFPRATDGEYVWSSRVGLNNITDSVLKAAYVAEQRTTGRKLQNARARARGGNRDGSAASAAKRGSKIGRDLQTESYRDDKRRYLR
jgi:hypothetical protein